MAAQDNDVVDNNPSQALFMREETQGFERTILIESPSFSFFIEEKTLD